MNEQLKNYREMFRREIVPKYYCATGHILFNFLSLLILMFYFISQLDSITNLELLTIPVMLILGNLNVYLIHRYPLHRRFPLIGKLSYDVHSKMHHQFYTSDCVVYEEPKDFYILFFPPWTILAFAGLVLPSMYFVAIQFLPMNITWLVLFGSTFYFFLYETIHYCCHLPESHVLLKFPPLKFMWNHHRLHHDPKLMRDYNFNIVFPLFDIVFGTSIKK